MKRKKIRLDSLKVQSFVTCVDKDSRHTARGGFSFPYCGGESIKIACLSQGAQICSDDSC